MSILDYTPEKNPEQTDTLDISRPANSSLGGIINQELLEQRALKYSIALGNSSPGEKEVLNLISSGQEGELRRKAVEEDTKERTEQTKSLILAGAEVTDDPILVRELGKITPKNPETVLEENFAAKATDLMFSLVDNDEFHESGVTQEENFQYAVNHLIDNVAKKEGFQKIYEDYSADYEDKGFFTKGYHYLAGAAIPFLTWMNMSNEISVKDGGSLLPYSNLVEQINEVWSLPAKEAIPKARELIENVYRDNPVQGMEVASILLSGGLTEEDKLFGNITELIAVPGYGIAGRILKNTAKGLLSKSTSLPKLLSGSGKIKEAAEVSFLRKEIEKGLPIRTQKGQQDLVEELPLLYDPDRIFNGAEGDYKTWLPRFAETANRQNKLFTRALFQPQQVATLESRIMKEALRATREDLLTKYNRLSDKIMRVKEEGFEKSPAGVAHVQVTFGDNAGEYFKTQTLAEKTAEKLYGFKKGSYDTEFIGDGWGITLSKDVNERDINLLDTVISTENVSNNRSLLWLDLLRGNPKDILSPHLVEQRSTATHSPQLLAEIMGEIGEPVRGLNNTQYNRLKNVMEANRDTNRIPGDPDSRGVFFHTVNELEEAYRIHNKTSVTEQEALAYFSFVRMMNFDYIFRNMTRVREMARKGAMEYTQKIDGMDRKFAGVRTTVDNLPAARVNTSVLVVNNKTGKSEVKNWTTTTRNEVKVLMEKEKYGFLHIYDPKKKEIMEDDIVNFVVTKTEAERPLSFKQIPYREGGHSNYDLKNKIVQPDILKKGEREVYLGDKIAFAAGVDDNANKFIVDALNTARLLYRKKDTRALKVFLESNLPITPGEFARRMKSGYYNPEVPFTVVKSGTKSLNKKEIKDLYPNAEDSRSNPYDLAGEDDITYALERDRILQEFRPNDKNGYHLENASQVDPILTQNREMSRLIRNRFFEPLKITTAESAVEEFGHLMTDRGKQIPKSELRRNPIYWFHNSDISAADGKLKKLQVESIRQAHKRLIGQPGVIEQSIGSFVDRIAAPFKDKYGFKYVTAKAIPLIKNPFSYFKAVAFYPKMAFYNVSQIAIQGQTLHNIGLLSPNTALQGTAAAALQRSLSLTESGEIIGFAAKKFVKLGIPGNFTEAQFLDSYKTMKDAGFDIVRGEHAFRDDMSEYELFSAKTGKKYLDKSAFFFVGTERFLRMSAWNATYLDYVRSNKIKGNISVADAAKIKVRAEALTGDMSRDAMSFWQAGPGGPFFQFLGYMMRMGDLLTGTRLTKKEKLALFSGISLLYGNNYAASVLYAIKENDPSAISDQFNPFGEDLRTHAIRNGIDLDESVIGAISNGMYATLFYAMTGKELNFGERFGLGGSLDTLESINRNFKENDNTLLAVLESALGASGNIMGDIIRSSVPMISRLLNPETASLETMKSDLIRLSRTVSTGNQIANIVSAMETGNYYSKNGTLLAEGVDPADALFHAMTGLQPTEVGDTFKILDIIKSEKKRKEKASKDITRYMLDYIQAYRNENFDKADELAREMDIIGRLSGMTSVEVSRMKMQSLRSVLFNTTLGESLADEYEGITDLRLQQKRRELLRKNKE